MDPLKKRRRSPLYIQLKEIIRAKIEDGEYAPGSSIPSENQLAETYGINRVSVHSALSALEGEGLIKSVQGKGFFVVGPKVTHDLEALGGFHQTLLDSRCGQNTKVMIKAIREAGPFYSQVLGVEENEGIWYIKRLCMFDGEPVALEELYIPCKYISGLEDVDITLFDIFDVYHWNGIRLFRGEQKLSVSRLDPAAARLIGIKDTNVVIEFTGVIYDEENRVIEFSRRYTRKDKSEYIVHFKKQ